MAEKITTDVLIIGAGAAGLCAAIAAREGNAQTLIASISSTGAGNSTAMSGAIMNAAVGPEDAPEIHFKDSLHGGAFLNDRPILRRVVERIPGLLPRLEEYGVGFLKANGKYDVFRSPGHTCARTVSFAPKVGTTLSKPLAASALRLGARALSDFQLIKVLIQDGRTVGALGYNWEADRFIHVAAKAVILATGGASLLYSRTRIPPGVPGDGYGIALAAGLTLQDMEFVQFFPTILAEPGQAKMLLTYETFFKAGAVLRNSKGEDIVAKYGLPEPDMITRDQLAIAMAREVYEGRGVDGVVLLDATACAARFEPSFFVRSNFGRKVLERRSQGEDILATPIRVAPANHYYMGGVVTGIEGETTVPGLLVCGEIVGGTHGANRLQGNSLAETVVMGFEVGQQASIYAGRMSTVGDGAKNAAAVEDELRAALTRTSGTPVRDIIKELQATMTAKAAMVRDEASLREAQAGIAGLRREIPRAIAVAPKERSQLCTLPQLFDTAESIVVSALARTESRGAHYRLDFPESDEAWTKHVTCAKRDDEFVVGNAPVKQ